MNTIYESQIPETLREIDPQNLSIYIDPIDSTNEFIKKNFKPATTLVGITKDTIPIVGFIYFPEFVFDGSPKGL